MSSFLVTIGNTSIDSGELCAFFLTSLLGDPSMLWFMPQYCNTLFFQADASTEVVVLSLIYAQRLVDAVGAAGVNQLLCDSGVGGVCLLVTVASRLAFKWHDDRHMWWRIVEWGPVSGIPLEAIDQFEWTVLEAINYELFVSEHEYNAFASLLASCFAPPPLPPPTPQFLRSPSSSPLVPVKAEPGTSFTPLVPVKAEPGTSSTPLVAVKAEPLSPRPFLPHIKVEELNDEHALLAAMLVKGESDLRAVSMPVVSDPNNDSDTINSSLRFSV